MIPLKAACLRYKFADVFVPEFKAQMKVILYMSFLCAMEGKEPLRFSEIFTVAIQAQRKFLDAYGKAIEVTYGIVPEQNMAIMEVASCIGLNMVEREKRNPMIANSRGVGLLLKDAVAKG